MPEELQEKDLLGWLNGFENPQQLGNIDNIGHVESQIDQQPPLAPGQ